MAKTGRSAKEKGKRYERKIAHRLRYIWPDARRNLDKWSDNRGQDLVNTRPFIIQCKHHEDWLPMTTILDMDIRWVDEHQNSMPILVLRATGAQWPDLVVMFWADLLDHLRVPGTHDQPVLDGITMRTYSRYKRPPINRYFEIVPRPGTYAVLVSRVPPGDGPQLVALSLDDWLQIMEPHYKSIGELHDGYASGVT